MNAIDAVFQRLRAAGRKAFVGFLPAGDPDLAATVTLARTAAAHGANLLEIGFPYSDPIADGPVIQASYTRALERGFKIDNLLPCVRQLAASPEFTDGRTPLVAMTSFSLIHRRGAETFLDQAQSNGFSGAIVPDLPFEESERLAQLAAVRDFKLIQLVTPTTPRPRARAIAERSTGFLYCVSVTGITGEREQLPAQLLDQLAWLREQTTLPLCVGFGVSKPAHVRMLREAVDGVIVGTALVRQIEQAATKPLAEVAEAVGALVQALATALNPGT
jgi:tryptophan synthase alpha chain